MHPRRRRVLQEVPDFAAIAVPVQPRMGAQLRLSLSHAIPPTAVKRARHGAVSGEPLPNRQAQPVDKAMGPNPDQLVFAHFDLAHTLHAGTNPLRGALQPCLDPEEVAPFLSRG